MKYLIVILLICFFACEEEYIPKTNINDQQYVVEAYVELGNANLPPYLILTRSIGFYSVFDTGTIESLFVHDASVVIQHENVDYTLDEICLEDLPVELRKEIALRLGIDLDSISVNYCVYIDAGFKIPIREMGSYQLEIGIGKDTLRSEGKIPGFIKIDTSWFDKTPGKSLDSFRQLFCFISDIPFVKDYYRYFTAGQGERLIPNFASVTDDPFFDGQSFKFTLSKALAPGEEFTDTTGYFQVGDTITIKWCNLDKAHFDFWNTLEISRTRQGPFASYVRIDGNIQGGLGIFGVQHCNNYQFIVK